MTPVHRADCEDCQWSEEGEDIVAVTDAMERHQRKELHDVDFQRAVATDGGRRSLGQIEGAEVLDFDGRAVLGLQGSDRAVGIHVPEDKVEWLKHTIEQLEQFYDDGDVQQTLADGGRQRAFGLTLRTGGRDLSGDTVLVEDDSLRVLGRRGEVGQASVAESESIIAGVPAEIDSSASPHSHRDRAPDATTDADDELRTDGGRDPDAWAADCQDCGYREVYERPTAGKTARERAEQSIGGHTKTNPDHSVDVEPVGGELHHCDICGRTFVELFDLVHHDCDADCQEVATDGGLRQQTQRQQVERLQRQHAAEDARQQRQSIALETGDEGKHGQRVWIVPEFQPHNDEGDYIVESVRDALPEYDCRMAVDQTKPMTRDRIMALLAGAHGEEADPESAGGEDPC